jgi:hypothetical protein
MSSAIGCPSAADDAKPLVDRRRRLDHLDTLSRVKGWVVEWCGVALGDTQRGDWLS